MGLLDDLEFLKQQRKPNLLADVQQLQRPAEPYLRQQYPEVYGGLGGLLGMAPDEMAGSILDPNTARVRAGAEYGFPVGTATQVVPALNLMKPAVAAGARALGPTAVRMGEGYLQRQGLMPGVVPEPPVSLGTPATPLASMIEKPQAPVSPMGFYSAAEQAALNIPRKSGTGESFLNDLMKGQDVKKEELSWLGLDDYLKGKPNVTRQEVQDYIAGNRVDVQEVRLGEAVAVAEDPVGIAKRQAVFDKYEPQIQTLYAEDRNYANLTPQRSEELGQEIRALERQRDMELDAAYVMPPLPQLTPTKYQQYQLPGGENYREILLTLPNQWDKPRAAQIANEERIKALRQEMYGTSGTNEIRSEISRLQNENTSLQRQISEAPIYKSSHFDEPNILAHMRVNDRVDADGKKMLLIEEIQSDWHQAGREKGYENPKVEERRKELEKLAWPYMEANKPIPAEIKAEIDALPPIMQKGVPDAPFKDTWHQLALKRALKYAADNGYDRVGLTTGRQQAERYQLSKQISRVEADEYDIAGDRQWKLKAYDLNGNKVISPSNYLTDKELAETIGKDFAKKIIADRGGEYKGLDLDVGGEGMKKYYDEIYPAFLAKQGKKYNAQVGETRIKTGQGIPGGAPIRYIDISPEMRGGVKKGQPLFTAAPIGGIGLGAGMQDNEMPDAVRQYMANPTPGLLQDEDERKLGGLLYR